MNINLVYITAGDMSEAEKLAQALVSSRLAACVNIFPQMTSVYFWEHRIQQENEVVMLAKTTAACIPALKQKVLSLHSYDCPCILCLPITGGHGPFLKWISDNVAEAHGGEGDVDIYR